MILYDYFRSSAAYRVRIALNLKELTYEQIPVNLLKNEQYGEFHTSRNPQGLVPCLEHDGVMFQQSLSICEYLDEVFPDRAALLPQCPEQRARVRALAQLIACDIHPLNNLRVLKYLKEHLFVDETEKQAWYQHWILEGFQALESLLQRSEYTGRFCHGSDPGLADLCLVPQVYNARRFEVDMACFPLISRIDRLCSELEAFSAAHPENFGAA